MTTPLAQSPPLPCSSSSECPPRPSRRDPEIIAAAATKLAPQVIEWMTGTDSDLPQLIEDLKKAMRWDSDGYQLARRMDDYEPDAQLVEILDEAGHLVRAEHEKACIAWVEANGLKGPEIGARVKYHRQGEELGTVTRNWPEGRSTVAFASLGHVTEGMGSHGFILEWEALTLG